MSRVFLTMAMSLDGFITGPDDDAQNPDAQNPAGIDGMSLMDWLDGVRRDEDAGLVEGYRPADPVTQLVVDEAMSTGDFAGYRDADRRDRVVRGASQGGGRRSRRDAARRLHRAEALKAGRARRHRHPAASGLAGARLSAVRGSARPAHRVGTRGARSRRPVRCICAARSSGHERAALWAEPRTGRSLDDRAEPPGADPAAEHRLMNPSRTTSDLTTQPGVCRRRNTTNDATDHDHRERTTPC